MRQSLGTAVLFGMIGVTAFGLLFTPAFYTFVRKLGEREAGMTHEAIMADVGIGAADVAACRATRSKSISASN
jgi:hypothetical protein